MQIKIYARCDGVGDQQEKKRTRTMRTLRKMFRSKQTEIRKKKIFREN